MAFLFADRPALLKDLDNDEARVIEYERVRDRWFAFTVPFSIAHGCVVTLITYASTVQGTELANCGLAAFYACYTLSALTLATVFVDREGPRRSMLIGFGAYCVLMVGWWRWCPIGAACGRASTARRSGTVIPLLVGN